ncbi:MAG TPA: ThuA domain-containing protein [Candidatus Dormibacteraeota bacterium]|nr:ThuA domain-containing protein [Candidatus Dormibacteraeota bacterium]
MKRTLFSTLLVSVTLLITSGVVAAEPLRALMITGGCCHDYAAQKKILSEGISARANVTWTIIHEGDSGSRDTKFSIYEKPDWAKGFDVVLHNECSGFVSNATFVEHIAKAHFEGVPSVVLHCSIHSYRYSSTDEWRKMLGVSSYRHQTQRPFDVEVVKADHPVIKGWPLKWHDDPDELYEIKKVWPECVPLAEALTPKNETDRHPVIWVNTYGKGRVFGTTIGHSNQTMQRPEYLDLVARGLLWACDKLDENGKAKEGYGKN